MLLTGIWTRNKSNQSLCFCKTNTVFQIFVGDSSKIYMIPNIHFEDSEKIQGSNLKHY